MEKTMCKTGSLEILKCKDLIDRYEYFLLDAYGVFWGSSKVGMLPGAKEAMEHLVSRGKKVGILSNSTQLALKEKRKFAKHGVQEGIHYHFILTSGQVTRDLLVAGKLPFPAPRKKYWLFGADHPNFSKQSILFEGSGYSETKHLEEADFIYIAIPHIDGVDQEDPDVFSEEVRKVAVKSVPVLCANPDQFAHEGLPPRMVVRQGTIARMFEAEGALVCRIGKPFSPAYERALELFPEATSPKEIVMVGDTPETDIRGGRQMGMTTALVVKTGIMKERINGESASLAVGQLPESDQPHYVIERFEVGTDSL